MRDVFFDWLKERGILDEYCREYVRQHFHVEEADEYLESSLVWEATTRGDTGWDDIDNEWCIYLDGYEWRNGKKETAKVEITIKAEVDYEVYLNGERLSLPDKDES